MHPSWVNLATNSIYSPYDRTVVVTRHLSLVTASNEAGMIRVLVSANSPVELAGLKSLIKSAPSLQLVGSTLGGTGLAEQIEGLRPDVVLQQPVDEEWHLSGRESD